MLEVWHNVLDLCKVLKLTHAMYKGQCKHGLYNMHKAYGDPLTCTYTVYTCAVEAECSGPRRVKAVDWDVCESSREWRTDGLHCNVTVISFALMLFLSLSPAISAEWSSAPCRDTFMTLFFTAISFNTSSQKTYRTKIIWGNVCDENRKKIRSWVHLQIIGPGRS